MVLGYLAVLPILCGTNSVLFALGFYSAWTAAPPSPALVDRVRRQRAFFAELLAVIAVTVVGYSALPHKEMRFVFPVVPLVTILAAASWVNCKPLWRWRVSFTVVILVVNFAAFIAFGVFFQRGTVGAIDYIRSAPLPASALREAADLGGNGEVEHRVDVLMGCHATPGYAAVHTAVTGMRQLHAW